jgi:hypothetical protein
MSRIHEAQAIIAMVGYWLTNEDRSDGDDRANASLALSGAEKLLDAAYSEIDPLSVKLQGVTVSLGAE